MPKIKALEDPTVVSYVENRVTAAVKTARADAVRSAKAVTVDLVTAATTAGDRALAAAHRNHGRAIAAAIKG